MKKSEKLKKKINNYLFDHIMLRRILFDSRGLLSCFLAGTLFAFGFTCFITPYGDQLVIVTGGVSGISQNIYLVTRFFTDKTTLSDITSIFYFALNVPILIFAFFAVSKRFSILSLVSVASSSVFIRLFPMWFASEIGELVAQPLYGGVITRVIVGATCTGISSALAYRSGSSCGGIDVFTYYFALRKSTSVGKYAIAINGMILVVYTTLSICQHPVDWEKDILLFFFAIAYLFLVAIIIDFINVRNKKVQVQIITGKEHMSEVLLANFPHSATIVRGRGAYSGTDKNIIYMVVSSSEVNKVVFLAKRVDEHVFISVISLVQAYGNFFIKPID